VQKGLECKVQCCESQIRHEVKSKEAESSKHAQQQHQLQASRDALQKQLAVTEAEFRLALQVLSTQISGRLSSTHMYNCRPHDCTSAAILDRAHQNVYHMCAQALPK